MKRARPHPLDLVLIGIGLAMLVTSGLMGRWTADWWQAALLTVGAAVLLGVVLRWVSSAIREATDEARDAAMQATEAAGTATREATEAHSHAEAAAASEARVRADLHTLDERIAAAMAQDQLPVVAAARTAAEALTPTTLRDAIREARQVGSLSTAAPMVPVQDAESFWVRVDATDEGIKVQLGREKRPLDSPWIEVTDEDLEPRLVEIGRLVKTYAPELEPAPQKLLGDVAALLEEGGVHSDHFGLFARFGDWGSAPGYVVYLGTAHDTAKRRRAIHNAANRLATAPRGMTRQEQLQFLAAQGIAGAPRGWFDKAKRH